MLRIICYRIVRILFSMLIVDLTTTWTLILIISRKSLLGKKCKLFGRIIFDMSALYLILEKVCWRKQITSVG